MRSAFDLKIARTGDKKATISSRRDIQNMNSRNVPFGLYAFQKTKKFFFIYGSKMCSGF